MHRFQNWSTEGTTADGGDWEDEPEAGERLHVFGLNHRTAPLALRERFACGGRVFHSLIQAFAAHCRELVPLGTCNRSEWICLTDDRGRAACREALRQIGELSEEELASHFYCLNGRSALEHLCGVAAGLDSLVLGETQILGQVKTAFNGAFESEYAGRELLPVYHQILHVAKAVRRQTQIGEGTLSYGSLTVQAARDTLGDLSTCHVVLIGAGKMSRLAGSHLAEAGVGAIRVLNRSTDKGEDLADSIGAEHHPIEHLPEAIGWADIIVSATACPHTILTAGDLAAVLQNRNGKPICLVDLAMPRDIDPRLGEDARVSLYDIDAFQQLIAANHQARLQQSTKAEALIKEKVGTFLAESQVELSTVMKALQQRAEALREDELQRLYKRFDHWSADEREQVAQSMRLLLTRFQHAPVKSLREEVTAEPNPAAATNPIAYFSRLFKLDMEDA